MKKQNPLSWNVVKAAAQQRSPFGFKSISVDDLRDQTNITAPFGVADQLKVAYLDTETTGLSSDDRIIELCVMKDEQAWMGKFNPDGKSIELGAMRVHGITEQMLEGKPLFQWRAMEVLRFLEGTVWCAHNAPFDARFMAMEFARAAAHATPGSDAKECFTRFVNIPFFDTRRLGPLMGLSSNCHLAELCRACGMDGDRQRHSAAEDTMMLKRIVEQVLA